MKLMEVRMLEGVAIGVGGVILGFVGFVATRNGKFRYERSGLIEAPPERIFPYLSDFRLGSEWSPYEKKDPSMKKKFSGPAAGTGSVMEFEGNRDVGAGKLEILKVVPNELVEIRLTMLRPFRAENIVTYRLTPESGGTRFSWSMQGDGGFFGKLMNVLIDCEAMVADEFSAGIQNLKNRIESTV